MLHSLIINWFQKHPVTFYSAIKIQMNVIFLPGVIYQIRKVQVGEGQFVYCMWLSRDPEDPGEGGRSYANFTLASSLNSTMDPTQYSLGEVSNFVVVYRDVSFPIFV